MNRKEENAVSPICKADRIVDTGTLLLFDSRYGHFDSSFLSRFVKELMVELEMNRACNILFSIIIIYTTPLYYRITTVKLLDMPKLDSAGLHCKCECVD